MTKEQLQKQLKQQYIVCGTAIFYIKDELGNTKLAARTIEDLAYKCRLYEYLK